MKRKELLVVFLGLILVLSGCGSQAQKSGLTTMTAEEVVQQFVNGGFPIDNVIVYTEETDGNQLLGKPGSYTGKVNFADVRVDQYSSDSPVGGSVEVFESASDAQDRYDYVSSITSEPGPFFQYSYLYENVLLRIDGALTTEQAAEYENAFKTLQADGKPQYTGEEFTITKTTFENDTLTTDGATFVLTGSELTTDYDGNPVIVIKFDYTNTGEESIVIRNSWNNYFNAKQNTGATTEGLDSAYLPSDSPYNDYDELMHKEINPGATVSGAYFYEIADSSVPVDLEIYENIFEDPIAVKSYPTQ